MSSSISNGLPPVHRFEISSLRDIADIERAAYDERVPFKTTAEILEYAARTHGPAPALRFQQNADPDESPLVWSFEDFRRNVVRAANLLRSLGVAQGEPVALLVPHIPSALFALWGAQLAGCAFPINYLLAPEHVAHLLQAANVRVVVTLAPCAELSINAQARKAAELSGCVRHLLEIDPDEADPAPGSFQQRLRMESDALEFQPGLAADSVAALFHTGGTTGLPKILRHSHRNEVHTSWFGGMYYGMRAGDSVLNGFPIFHVAGTFVYGLAALAAGASLFLPTLTGMRNQDFVRQAWRFIHRDGITHLGCVPTVLSALLPLKRGAGEGDSVRVALTGGSPLPNELAAQFEDAHRIPVRSIFGMTECAGIVSIEPYGAPRRPGSVGLRLPYSETIPVPLELASADTLTDFCKAGEPGIVAVRGPHVSAGYLDAGRNQGTFTRDGWLLSGDLGYVDGDGYLYITGRSKDLIIRSGHNIEPGLIEEAFLKHPAVGTCAAVGEPDGYAGELPVVFVTLRNGAEIGPEELLKAAAGHIPERPAWPKKVTVVDRLPTTPIGKVYKPALRAMAAQAKVEEILAASRYNGLVSVECSAEASGLLVDLRSVPPLDEEAIAGLKALLAGLPVQLRFA